METNRGEGGLSIIFCVMKLGTITTFLVYALGKNRICCAGLGLYPRVPYRCLCVHVLNICDHLASLLRLVSDTSTSCLPQPELHEKIYCRHTHENYDKLATAKTLKNEVW